MTIEEMKAKKTEYGLTNEWIADASGVPLGTVQKIFCGLTKAPRKLTIEAIEKVLQKEQQCREGAFSDGKMETSGVLRDAGTGGYASSLPVRHTVEEYYALPEDQRVELIDGVFYDMGAPTKIHQMLVGELYLLFRRCIDEHDPECEVFLSPSNVQLDRDIYTMVQPDLLIICHDHDYQNVQAFQGAPDLCVEILSPSSRSKDMLLKLHKYQNAGVREYWIVDPKNRKVLVYRFEEDDYFPAIYDFDDPVPIGISQNRCSIDFSGIRKKMDVRGW